MPSNHPAAINGFKEVIGAAIKAVRIANGCPKAIAVPSAEREPFHTTQLTVCCIPAAGVVMNEQTMSAMIPSGMVQAIILGTLDFFGIAESRARLCSLLISSCIPGIWAAPKTATTFFPGASLIFWDKY